MRVIPVIDLLGGQAVRGIAGERANYRPLTSQIAADASPATVARAFVERYGFRTVYVADLDAIMHQRPDFDSWQKIAALGLQLWLDAGIGDSAMAAAVSAQAKECGIEARWVIGLESLSRADDLTAMCAQLPDPIFSLDLKTGIAQTSIDAWQRQTPLEIAGHVERAGIRDLIVLDLADVGTGGGTRTLSLCRELRRGGSFREIIAGGGVRDAADLATLADAGCTAALVASALHNGRLTPLDLEA